MLGDCYFYNQNVITLVSLIKPMTEISLTVDRYIYIYISALLYCVEVMHIPRKSVFQGGQNAANRPNELEIMCNVNQT